jgi:hypothetical protein
VSKLRKTAEEEDNVDDEPDDDAPEVMAFSKVPVEDSVEEVEETKSSEAVDASKPGLKKNHNKKKVRQFFLVMTACLLHFSDSISAESWI